MKMWTVPAVAELNVELTANGILCCDKEFCFVSHQHTTCDKDKTDDVAQS